MARSLVMVAAMAAGCGGPAPLAQPNPPPEWPLHNLSMPAEGTATPAPAPEAPPEPAPADETAPSAEPVEPVPAPEPAE